MRWADRGGSFPVLALVLLLAGLLLGAVHLSFDQGGFSRIRKAAGILAAVVGAFFGVAWLETPRGQLHWEHSEDIARQRAQTEAKPLLIDFTAEWCGACKELARHTFANPAVMKEAGRFVAVKVDATSDEDAAVDAVKDRYRVVGLPTVIVLGSDGRERARFTEFVPPEQFLTKLRAVD